MARRDTTAKPTANLSRQAAADLVDIYRRSARLWGAAVARRSRDRLLAWIATIAAGTAVGHKRDDVSPPAPTAFIVEEPWVIAYNPETREVYRVLHGSRDFPALFPPASSHRP